MFSEELFETVSTRHGAVTFFANDTGAISESLRKYGEWAENELQFMLWPVGEGATILDVGAYIGTHTLAFAEHVGGKGNIVSVEAQIRSFELLQRNIRANELRNVRIENAMASSETSDAVICSIDIASPASYGSASLKDVAPLTQDAAQPENVGLTVRAIAIDDLDLPSCSLLKIDVEGMEDVVLSGARQTIERCKPVIYAECNSLEDGLRSVVALKAFGYRIRAHVVMAYNADNYRHNETNIFGGACEVALVAVPKSGHDPFANYVLRTCELLIDVETADDLALALLNKPQYEHEILRVSAAARSGGLACLEEVRLTREACEERQAALDRLRVEHESLRKRSRQMKSSADQAEVTLRKELVAAHVSLARESASANEARQRAGVAEATLETMRRTTSWRMTGPLRALGRVMRGGRD